MDDSFMQITDAKISKKISSLISQYIPSSFEKKILEMFQEQDNISDFSHILELEGNGFSKRGIISAKRVKYHRFVRSRLYKEWLKKFIRSKEDFSFMYFGDAFVLTTNLYGMLILTLGIHISSFNIDHRFDGMKGMIDFLKGKAVSLGEKILS